MRGRPSGRMVSASEKVYRALMRAYPEEIRGEYGREMARCFRDLCRREAGRRGVPGLVLLWARTLAELALTAFKERGVMLARDPNFLPFTPATTVRLGAVAAIVGGVFGIAYVLTWAVQGPNYYRVSPAFVDLFSMTGFYVAQLMCVLGFFGLYGAVAGHTRRSIGSRLFRIGGALGVVAAALWLGHSAFEIAVGVAEWPTPLDGTTYIPITLLNVLFVGGFACWIAGLIALGFAALISRLPSRLCVLPFATVALWPASIAASSLSVLLYPDNYGLDASGDGYGLNGVGDGVYLTASALSDMLPFLGSLLVGLVLLRDLGNGSVGTSAASLAGPAGTREPVTERARRLLHRSRRAARNDVPATAVERERELLEALRRRGELTVAGAALETSLTVEDADRMLSVLAAKGHLEVRAERGSLLYSLWEGDAPGA